MRRLSKEEQDLCIKILNGNGNNNYLQNIIDDKLQDVRISINRELKRVELLFQTINIFPTDEEGRIIVARINTLSLEIMTAVNLISLLQKEGYIMLYQKANRIDNESSFGGLATNLKYVANKFGDNAVSGLLIDYSTKEIVTTVEFTEFCNHGFIARDEQRFKRQIGIAYLALTVALFAAFTNLFFNLWTKLSGGTKIKQEQVDTLLTRIKAIENKIDTATKNINTSKLAQTDRPGIKPTVNKLKKK